MFQHVSLYLIGYPLILYRELFYTKETGKGKIETQNLGKAEVLRKNI